MDSMREKFAARDRLMKAMYLAMSPEERVRRARALHEWGLAQLQSNPAGYARFIQRNLRLRATRSRYV